MPGLEERPGAVEQLEHQRREREHAIGRLGAVAAACIGLPHEGIEDRFAHLPPGQSFFTCSVAKDTSRGQVTSPRSSFALPFIASMTV